jgi:uncharacterized protein YkwD
MWRLRIFTSFAALLAFAATLQPVFAMNADMLVPSDPTATNLVTSEQALLDLTNADRLANGDAPLQFDPDTISIARERAESQLGAANLSHYDDNGQLIFARLLADSNVSFGLAGENLARATGGDANLPQAVEQALMQSPLHRKNILERTFTRVAIGAATDPATGQIAFAEIYRN